MGEEMLAAGDIRELRAQLREAYDLIDAIRTGAIDSLVIGPPGHEQVYSLISADRPYRLIVESMSVGIATVSAHGIVMYANPAFAQAVGRPRAALVGTRALVHFASGDRSAVADLLVPGEGREQRTSVSAATADGSIVAMSLVASVFDMDGTPVRCLVLTAPDDTSPPGAA
jgi:PAS domain S-box-containing protein